MSDETVQLLAAVQTLPCQWVDVCSIDEQIFEYKRSFCSAITSQSSSINQQYAGIVTGGVVAQDC